MPLPRLSQTEQDTLIIFAFWTLLLFLSGALVSLILRFVHFIFRHEIEDNSNNIKRLESKH